MIGIAFPANLESHLHQALSQTRSPLRGMKHDTAQDDLTLFGDETDVSSYLSFSIKSHNVKSVEIPPVKFLTDTFLLENKDVLAEL